MWHGNLDGMTCRREFDAEEMWEMHIDPYSNLQTCCGIVIGNLAGASLQELIARGFAESNRFVAAVCDSGPVGLLDIATEHGYEPREAYPQKCALCWDIRKFLRPLFPDVFSPKEIYERDPGRRPWLESHA